MCSRVFQGKVFWRFLGYNDHKYFPFKWDNFIKDFSKSILSTKVSTKRLSVYVEQYGIYYIISDVWILQMFLHFVFSRCYTL